MTLAAVLFLWLVCVPAAPALSQEIPDTEPPPTWTEASGARPAFVVDRALAAVRASPSPNGQLKQRLRIGRRVYILRTRRGESGAVYHWIAVTRRTRGWIDARALVQPGYRGDDARLVRLIAAEPSGYERIQLAVLFLRTFPRSARTPSVLLYLGKAAMDETPGLTHRADRRVGEAAAAGNADAAAYFANDVGLDRFNRLGVMFRFRGDRYEYDGWAFRQLLRRFPRSVEAEEARRLIGASFLGED